jgi:hypothetical protein
MLHYLYKSFRLDGKTMFQGLPIDIENAKGSVRQGVSVEGVPWKTVMRNDYGYIRGVMGVDGDELDVFVGPDKDSEDVWVAHQEEPFSDKYDEDKVFLGFSSEEDFRAAFRHHYDHPDRFEGQYTHYKIKDFKKIISKKKRKAKKLSNKNTKDMD